jgi:hypothetical protein
MDADTGGYEKTDWLAFVLTAASVLMVYLFTLTPDVSLGFSGIFSTAAMYGGVPHPPGYPVAVWWQGLFVHLLPVSNIAWRVAVSSAVAGALACGLIALIVSRLGKELIQRCNSLPPATSVRIVCGSVAGAIFGFNGAFWGRAVIADVWTLSICLFCGALCLLLRWCFTPGRTRYLCLSAFVYGLTLTNSQILLAAAPAIPALLVAAGGASLPRWRTVVGCIAAFLLGLAPYLYLPIASMTNPPMNWGYARTVGGFYHVISRGQYESIQLTSEMTVFAKQVAFYGAVTVKEFGWPCLVIASIPWVFFRHTPRRVHAWLLALAVVYLCFTLLLIAVLNPVDHLDGRRALKVFFSASYVVLAVWVGFGLIELAAFCDGLSRRRAAAAGDETRPSQWERG